MKKLIIAVILVLVIISLYILKTTHPTNARVLTAEQAISIAQEKYPDLKEYPSENLPPKRIETKDVEDGWLLGFYTEGSGLPGILSAKCYRVTDSEKITLAGEFNAGGTAGPRALNLATCKELSTEVSRAYFTDTVTIKVSSTVENYASLGLGGGVDGFVLVKTYPNLVPSDFIGVLAGGGEYGVYGGKLQFTGHAASNSAVLTKEGMKTLLENIALRLGMPASTTAEVDAILAKIS